MTLRLDRSPRALASTWVAFQPTTPTRCSSSFSLPAPPPGRNLRQFTSVRHRMPRPPPLMPSDSVTVDSANSKKRALVADQGRWPAEDGSTTFILSPVTFDFYSPVTSPTSPLTPRQHCSSSSSSPILALTSTTRAQAQNVREEKLLGIASSSSCYEDYNGLLLTETSLHSLHALGYTSLSRLGTSSSSPTTSFRTASPDRFEASTNTRRHRRSSRTKIPEVAMDPLDVFFGISSAAEAKAFRSGLIGLGIETGVKGGWEGVEDLDPLLASSVQEGQEVQKGQKPRMLDQTCAPKKIKAGPKRPIRKTKSVKERLKHLFVSSSYYEQCD